MKREKFKVKSSNFNDWNEIFKNPERISVKSFITGYVKINKRGTLNPKHPNAGNIEDESLNVPILVHWIHHHKFGDYLVDAGLDSSYYQNPHGEMKGLFAGLFKKLGLGDTYFQEKNQDIAYHIKKNSIKLNGVFLSHLHSDHMTGARDLPKNIPYVVGMGEKYFEHKPLFYGDYLKGIEVLYEIDFLNAPNMPILGPCADIFGDGSFWAIKTPGHTRGHISFLINCIDGPVLLTTDACFIRLGFEKGIASSSYTDDVEMAQASLNNLVEFKRVYPQVKVCPGHEL
ncbi:MAG: MBL fold metallo-hydrolase [Methanobacterium sp.]|uniref:MBL fold metallo-hydrolase n=1 Tax=Methanobacterium sp. TaxID=2164 RepID=UPI003D64C756|nr:MBL fold metallo-hydrolase [Methanobacterium sp.]